MSGFVTSAVPAAIVIRWVSIAATLAFSPRSRACRFSAIAYLAYVLLLAVILL